MRFTSTLALAAALFASAESACAHGPQIQITAHGGKIVTRELHLDAPYVDFFVSDPKTVYVMPVKEFNGVWYSRPNGALLAGGIPKYYSGPGFAYGWTSPVADLSRPIFDPGSNLVLSFTAGLQSFNGSAFADAGATEVEAFTSSATLRTADTPSGSMLVPGGAGLVDTFQDPEAHATVRYRFFGDGQMTSVAPADGVYLLSLQVGTTQAGISPSDPFYFVLSKNGSPAEVQAAVASLGVDSALVQNLVPEPTSLGLGLIALGAVFRLAGRRSSRFNYACLASQEDI